MPTTYQDVLDLLQAIEPTNEAIASLDADALPYLETFITPPTQPVVMGTMGGLGNAPTEETFVIEPFFDVSLARRAAALAASIRDARALPIARNAAASNYPEVRLAVAATVWRLAEFGIADILAGLLNDADGGVRRFAVLSVAHITPGPTLEALRPRVEAALRFLESRDSEPAVRVVVPFVLQRLEGSPLTREDVARALETEVALDDVALAMGSDAIPHLEELVKSHDALQAARAVYVAGRAGGDAGRAVVRHAVENDLPEVRLAVAHAMARAYRPGDEDVLQRLLDDDEVDVRRMAIASASRRRDSPDVPQMLERVALTDPDPEVRNLAEDVLQRQRTRGAE